MKQLFDEVSAQCSVLTTRKYSTSFSMGILCLAPNIRQHIYAIYGFVRLADEIVDSFHEYPKKELLEKFESDTWHAIENKISLNPVLNSFQLTVHAYAIDHQHIRDFLHSMKLDLINQSYKRNEYENYIFGSAEVVGLMCLHVFTEGNKDLYDSLKPYAMKLGSAFQKVNFLRDLQSDYNSLGRTYFPEVDMEKFNTHDKKQIEEDIERDFDMAIKGIRMLPSSSRHGVYLAYIYFKNLLRKIQASSAEDVMSRRIRISNPRKAGLLLNSMLRYQFNLL